MGLENIHKDHLDIHGVEKEAHAQWERNIADMRADWTFRQRSRFHQGKVPCNCGSLRQVFRPAAIPQSG